MARRRSATILLLLLMSVASSIELEPVVAAGESLVNSVKTTSGSPPILDLGTGRGDLAGTPALCTVVNSVTQKYQTLCSAAGSAAAAGALGFGGLLNDVCLQGANLDALKTIVFNLPPEIISKLGLPPTVTDYLYGALGQVTPNLRGFTIGNLDNTLGGTLGVTTLLDDIPGFKTEESVIAELYTAGGTLLDPVEDAKELVIERTVAVL